MADTVITGSRCLIKINGPNGPQLIGWGLDVRVDVRHQNLLVEAIGYPHPIAIEPVGVQVDVTVSFVRLLENDPNKLGFVGDLSGQNPFSIVNFPPLTIEVYAQIASANDQRPICIVYGAKPLQYNFSVQGRSFAMQNVTFQGQAIAFTSQL